MFRVMKNPKQSYGSTRCIRKFHNLKDTQKFIIDADNSELLYIYESNKDKADSHVFRFNKKGEIINIDCGHKCSKFGKTRALEKPDIKLIPCKYESLRNNIVPLI